MDFQVQKFISNLIENQLPRFYQEEGPNFVLFTKAYYEWMEQKGNPIGEARNLLSYRDIDSTLEEFLSHFQQKYLYGIPFSIISNKRFLLKHILDVYRSKGTIQCYRLLFRLIYNEEVNIYLPGIDILKPSDGIWVEPKYIEVSTDQKLDDYVGKTIVGVESLTVGVVENFVKESFNNDVINILYVSNIQPQGSDFKIGEFLVPVEELFNFEFRKRAPTILGSLVSLDITDGGTNFKTGDLLKIADEDPFTKEKKSFGKDGLLKVSKIGIGKGGLKYRILDNGFGWMSNAQVFVYNSMYDFTGSGAKLDLNRVNSVRRYSYNTDLIADLMYIPLNASKYPFLENPSANKDTRLVDALNYNVDEFGSIYEFSEAIGGSKYTEPADVFIRSTISSGLLPGKIQFSSERYKVSQIKVVQYTSGYSNGETITVSSPEASVNALGYVTTNDDGTITGITVVEYGEGFVNREQAIITVNTLSGTGGNFYAGFSSYILGDGTIFDIAFRKNSVLSVIEDTKATYSRKEDIIVNSVVNSEFMFVYSHFSFDSTDNSGYKTSPSILGSQYAFYEIMDLNGKIYGENENISATPSSGNNIVSAVRAVNSGKSYLENEFITAYPYACISTDFFIDNPGINYANDDLVVFSGGNYSQQAKGLVITDNDGSITGVKLKDKGSGYQSVPLVYIKSKTGSNASIRCFVQEYDTSKAILGRVKKGGYGVSRGFWETTRGFLDNDKYIQDSYYYQDYSYEIQSGRTIDVYKPIFENTFHPAGSEMFGKFLYTEGGVSPSSLVYEDTNANTNPNTAIFMLSDVDFVTSDSNFTVDIYFYYPVFVIKVSSTVIHSDDIDLKSDNEASTEAEDYKYNKNKKFKKEIGKWLTGK